MGKITRFIGNLAAFASAATGKNRTIFGPKGTATQSDDITDNINPDYLGGWELLGPSDKPTKQQFNALGFTHGQLLSYLHQMGVAEWDGAQEYQIGSIANRAGTLYSCLTADHVSATPPESDAVNWKSAIPSDLLNTTRIDVASAATVDLTANAPNTRHINITGSNSISAFTVSAGQCYFVRFDAWASLIASASIDTQSGLDIVAAPGDSLIIRATASDVVEVLCYTRAEVNGIEDVILPVGAYTSGTYTIPNGRTWSDYKYVTVYASNSGAIADQNASSTIDDDIMTAQLDAWTMSCQTGNTTRVDINAINSTQFSITRAGAATITKVSGIRKQEVA